MTSTPVKRLNQMIEDATVDCYDDEEQADGMFSAIEEGLALPFKTTVLGTTVTVTAVDQGPGNQIVAVCRRGADRQRIPLLDLPLPDPPPEGAEWIEAYRHWLR